MDLLKTLLIYLSVLFASSVQNAPEAMDILTATPEPTVYVAPVTPTPAPTPTPTPVPPIDITPNPEYKQLQMGDRGDLVRAMQEKLIEYGYLNGEADGAFGNMTRQAVEAFQYRHGLSVDGIAGKRTLTVLYESSEIRLASEMLSTPEPTPAAHLAVAITPSPTPTFIPLETVKTAKTIAPISKANPTATPAPELTPLTEKIVLSHNRQTLEMTAYRVGDEVYLPIVEILKASDILVLNSVSLEKDELAFAWGDDLIRLSYTENQQGSPAGLEAFVNTEPQLLPVRDIRRVDDVIYLPASTIQSFTGIETSVDESQTAVMVSFPE